MLNWFSCQETWQFSNILGRTDFFDTGVTASAAASNEENKETDESEKEKEKSMAEKLPEGFFDDPKADAKVERLI